MLIREINLGNDLQLQFFDESRHYYGGFHRVSVSVCCELPLRGEYFNDEAAFLEATAHFGAKILFSRKLERMGVPAEEIPAVREQLIDQFISSALTYLSNPEFPSAFIAAELEKLRKQRKSRAARSYVDAQN